MTKSPPGGGLTTFVTRVAGGPAGRPAGSSQNPCKWQLFVERRGYLSLSRGFHDEPQRAAAEAPPNAGSERPTRSGARSVNSCAQTAPEQLDRDRALTLRRRCRSRPRSPRRRPPARGPGPAPRGYRAPPRRRRRGATSAIGAGARRRHAGRARRARRRSCTTPVLAGAGHVLGLGGGDQRLAPAAQELGQAQAALGVELRHDVVEQHQRRPAAQLERAPRARPAAGRAGRRAAGPASRTRAAGGRRGQQRARPGAGRGR